MLHLVGQKSKSTLTLALPKHQDPQKHTELIRDCFYF